MTKNDFINKEATKLFRTQKKYAKFSEFLDHIDEFLPKIHSGSKFDDFLKDEGLLEEVNEKIKREEITIRSDKAIDELNDRSQKNEKLLKLFKSWQEEDVNEKIQEKINDTP